MHTCEPAGRTARSTSRTGPHWHHRPLPTEMGPAANREECASASSSTETAPNRRDGKRTLRVSELAFHTGVGHEEDRMSFHSELGQSGRHLNVLRPVLERRNAYSSDGSYRDRIR